MSGLLVLISILGALDINVINKETFQRAVEMMAD